MDYPEDLQLSEHRDIFLDGANDISTIGGVGQLEQSVMLDVGDEVMQLVGGNLDGPTVGKIEARVRQALNDDPQIASVQSVTLQRYDKTNNALYFSIMTRANNDFELAVNE